MRSLDIDASSVLVHIDLALADPLVRGSVRAAARQVQALFVDLVDVRVGAEPLVVVWEQDLVPVQTERAQAGLVDAGSCRFVRPGLPALGIVHLLPPAAHQFRRRVQALRPVARPGSIFTAAAALHRLARAVVGLLVKGWRKIRGEVLAEKVEGHELHQGTATGEPH